MKFLIFRFAAFFTLLAIILTIFGTSVLALPPDSQENSSKAASNPLPIPPPILSKALCGKGTYILMMNDQPVGRESFDVVCLPDGGYSATAHTDMRVAGMSVDVSTSLELDAKAIPSMFTSKGVVGGKETDQVLVMKEGHGQLTVNGALRAVPYTRGASFIAPNLIYLIPFFAARYDPAKGGVQQIPTFPNLSFGMERTARDVVQPSGLFTPSQPQVFDRYVLQFGVVSTVLWADLTGRVDVIFVPMQNFVAVREEYLSLMQPLRAAMTSAAKRVEPDYSAPPGASFTSEEVKVLDKEISLGGTLLLPTTGKPPFPAVVMITGSGQQTRDEPIPISGLEAYRPFRQIAELLASHGIAVLRVDDRGVGKSTGFETLAKVTTFDFADDTRAQINYLRSRKEIDPKRIALVGHSEGGMIAPMIAASDPKIAAIVLMAGPGKTGEAIILDQSSDLLDRDPTLTAQEKANNLEKEKVLLQTIIAGGDVSKLPDTVKTAWYKAFLTYDPLPTIRKVHQPILILQGALDRQVTADQADNLARAARDAGNRNVTVHVFPNLNHLFLPAKTGSFNEYSSLTVTSIPPEVLDTINSWLEARLKH